MPTNLILNNTNYNQPTLTNGKYYGNGSYACNYPINFGIEVVTDSGDVGSKYITISSGNFYELLGCDIQNNNTPVRKWLIGDDGQIFEIDYIISETEAVLKTVSSYGPLSGLTWYSIEYYQSISVLSTTFANTDGFGAVNLPANSKIGPLALNLGANQEIQMGSEPITVDLGSAGAGCQLTIKYQ